VHHDRVFASLGARRPGRLRARDGPGVVIYGEVGAGAVMTLIIWLSGIVAMVVATCVIRFENAGLTQSWS
jgi:hypothetical protein